MKILPSHFLFLCSVLLGGFDLVSVARLKIYFGLKYALGVKERYHYLEILYLMQEPESMDEDLPTEVKLANFE
jgi:hypothetical protein